LKVKFFAYIRDNDYAGTKELILPACADLRTLGETLSDRYGRKFRELYFSADGNDFGDEVIILVNGRRAEFLNGMETELKDTDTVLIYPVVAGG